MQLFLIPLFKRFKRCNVSNIFNMWVSIYQLIVLFLMVTWALMAYSQPNEAVNQQYRIYQATNNQTVINNPIKTNTKDIQYSKQIDNYKIILIIGDSISSAYGLSSDQGWVNLLAAKLIHTSYRVQNASLSGETTSGGVQRLPALLKQYKPAIVVIELGGNDALRGLPLAQTKANLDTMVSMSKQAKAKVLLLPMQIPPNYGATYVKAFNGLYAQLAKTHGIAITPFIFKDFADNLSYFQTDRIHPTAAAQVFIVSTVLPDLKKLLK